MSWYNKITMMPPYPIPKAAFILMSLLEDKGFEAYIIGGYVRDLLLGRFGGDIDMATNASTQQMIELFKDYPLSRIGEKLGTIGVKIMDQWIEITTYRSEGTSSNYRHPDEVRFIGSLKDDVLRRDFTINAMSLNIYGDLIDYTDGCIDLKKRQIKAIGLPEERFQEDALRILRALRFSVQLGFTIEDKTSLAMMKAQELVKTLPIERISVELDKLIQSDHLAHLFENYPDLLRICIDYDPKHIQYIDQFTDKGLRYLCLLNHLDAEKIKNQLTHLKHPKRFVQKVSSLKILSEMNTQDRYIMKTLLGTYGKTLILLTLEYQKTLNIEGIDPMLMTQLIDESPCVSLKDLAINGDDLLKMGHHGKSIKDLLNQLLELVMKDEIPNVKASLSQAVSRLS